jgi:hypothetical protein
MLQVFAKSASPVSLVLLLLLLLLHLNMASHPAAAAAADAHADGTGQILARLGATLNRVHSDVYVCHVCCCCCCCCCQANIHSDGRYGFIEFRSAEYATAALELNGQINLMNQSLQIGRPASYVDPNKVSRWYTCSC